MEYRIPDHLIKKGLFLLILSSLVILIISLTVTFNKKVPPNNFYIKNGLIHNQINNDIYTGSIIDTINNKTIKYEVVKGLKNGDFTIYFPNGNVELKGKMKKNKNEGEWKYYYPSGNLQSTGYFKNDILTGKWVWFYENGRIKECGHFAKGKREGKWDVFDEYGKLKAILHFNNGRVITKIDVSKKQSI